MRLINNGKGIGDEIGPKVVKRRDHDGKVKDYVHVPEMFSGIPCPWVRDNDQPCRCDHRNLREHKDGNVYVALPGYGFAVVPRGGSFDLPPGIPAKAIRNMCPHLVSEDENDAAEEEVLDLSPAMPSLSSAAASPVTATQKPKKQ